MWSTPAAASGFMLLYGALGVAGRLTVHTGSLFAPLWPAAGVAVVWFLARGAGGRSVDTVLLAAAAFAVNALTGAPLDVAALFVATNLLQTLLTVGLLRRWAPDLWGCGGDRPLDSPRVLSWFVLAAVLGAAATAVVGSTVAALLTTTSADLLGTVTDALLWFGRDLGGVLGIASFGLLLGQRLDTPRTGRPRLRTTSTTELVALVLLTVTVYVLAFAVDSLPLGFPLLAASVWVGLRFRTLLAAAHYVVVGAVAVRLTIAGIGPFASVGAPGVSALVVQLYVVTIVMTSLTLATGRDEREQLQRALRHSEAETAFEMRVREAAIGSMTAGLVVVDEVGEVLLHNAAASELFAPPGQALSEVSLAAARITRPDGSAVPFGERPTQRALAGEPVPETELLVAVAGRRERVLAVSAVPLPRDDLGGRARALLLCRDTTTEHASRQELSAFAQVVAHDLRNPLAAIDGWAAMVAEEIESGQPPLEMTTQLIDRVRSSTARMRGLIGDLLAHATSDSRELELGPVDVRALVLDVARARHAEREIDCGELPPVLGDPVLLRQVVDNLLGNALKYVAPGERPQVSVRGRTAGDQVTLEVADEGIGVPPGQHERVFEEFHRAHRAGYEGSGLGLAICRRIVVRHGGTIVAGDNPRGRGTVFRVTLPAAGASGASVPAGHHEGLPAVSGEGVDGGPAVPVG